MSQQDRYNQIIEQRRLRNAEKFNAEGSGVADYSGGIAPGVGREALESAQKKGISDAQNRAVAPEQVVENAAPIAPSSGGNMGAVAPQSSPLGTIGQAGMMSGNPYLMAGGLGLSVLAQGEQNKRAQEEAERQAYNERIKARQEAMSQIAKMGIQ